MGRKRAASRGSLAHRDNIVAGAARNGEIMREALRERESKGGDNSHDEVPGRKEGCDI